MPADISQLVFPKASGHCQKVIEILSVKEPDFKSLEAALSRDDVLSNAIIKYSNSPVHRRENEITDVNTATNILGLTNVYNAVLATVLKDYLRDNVTGDRILQHSVTISAIASLIASGTAKFLQHEVELLGLLHDLPSMVLCRNFKPEYRSMAKTNSKSSEPLAQLEQELFGLGRCDLLEHAMRELGLPDKMRNTLTQYHAISETEQAETDKTLSILSLAHHMEMSVVPDDQRLHDTVPGERERLQQQLAISDDDYTSLINKSRTVINEHIALVA